MPCKPQKKENGCEKPRIFEQIFGKSDKNPVICSPKFLKGTFLNRNTMSRVCEITGKKALVGNKVSHSNTKTKRKFDVNLKVKKFFLPEENKWITIRISTSALRTINKNGIAAVVKEAREKGHLKK
jgi:large subunit ribosomal protein L28